MNNIIVLPNPSAIRVWYQGGKSSYHIWKQQKDYKASVKL